MRPSKLTPVDTCRRAPGMLARNARRSRAEAWAKDRAAVEAWQTSRGPLTHYYALRWRRARASLRLNRFGP